MGVGAGDAVVAKDPRTPAPHAPGRGHRAATRTFIRGSGLLVSGRAISLLLNFATQVLAVRYLSKSDYGAFAYALGVAAMGTTAALFGFQKSVPRFIPIYQERGEFRKMFGAVALAVLTIVGLGLSLVLLLHGFQGVLLGRVVGDPLSLALLLILITLAPIDALDYLLIGLLATFASPRAIFFRRHILGPTLRLAAVLLVLATAGHVHQLAYGYVAGGIIGVATYVAVLVGALQKQGLLQRLRADGLELPAKDVFSYSLPLFTSEILVMLKTGLAVVLLEFLQSTVAVADYKAVLPLARLNVMVMQSFSLLFIPVAARMFARGEREGINDLFWQTATWIAVLSFPFMAVTTTLAQPLTLLLFGSRYAGSAQVLAVLSVGFYVHAALGTNTATLGVCGRVRYLVVTDVLTAVFGVGMLLWLIPRHGALGAAVASSATLILNNLLHHLGFLGGRVGVRLVEPRHLRVYAVIAVAAASLVLVGVLLAPPLYLGIPLAAAASFVVLRSARGVLDAGSTFPELLRIPLLRRILS